MSGTSELPPIVPFLFGLIVKHPKAFAAIVSLGLVTYGVRSIFTPDDTPAHSTSSPAIPAAKPNAVTKPAIAASGGGDDLAERLRQIGVLLRSYDGKIPDKQFWESADGVFIGTSLIGQGSGGSMALQSFENGLGNFAFSPCQYDPKTNTITVTWTTAPGAGQGDIAEGLYGTKAVSFDLNKPDSGIVASWEDAAEGASLTFYGNDKISPSDASQITKGDLSSLPPALAGWAVALSKQSTKQVNVSVQ